MSVTIGVPATTVVAEDVWLLVEIGVEMQIAELYHGVIFPPDIVDVVAA